MRSLIFIVSTCVWVVNGKSLVYIDRHKLEFNEKISNWSTSYIRVENGSSLINLTFTTFTTVKKMLIYLTLKVAEDSNDKEFRRVFVRTVIDVKRFFDGSQTNPILRSVIKNLQHSMDFRAKFPMPPEIPWKFLWNLCSSWLNLTFNRELIVSSALALTRIVFHLTQRGAWTSAWWENFKAVPKCTFSRILHITMDFFEFHQKMIFRIYFWLYNKIYRNNTRRNVMRHRSCVFYVLCHSKYFKQLNKHVFDLTVTNCAFIDSFIDQIE